MTRTGKIARLPKQIREELNHRLENGERAPAILKWLNQLPEVQKLITEQFAGHPIRPQNLSQWRNGGYLDWTRHQLLREQTRQTAEQADDLGLDTTGNSISIAEDIATVMSAELAIHVQTLRAIKNPKARFRQFRLLSRELSRLRRDDQRAIRTQLRRQQWQSTLAPSEEDNGTAIPPETTESLRASASDLVTYHSPLVTAPTPERQKTGALQDAPRNSEPPAERASVPDCGSPLPLSDNSSTPKLLNSQTFPEPPYNPPLPNLSILNPKHSPTPPPLPPNPTKSHHKIFTIPTRGRRFVCVEG